MKKVLFAFAFCVASGLCTAGGKNECPELAKKNASLENEGHYLNLAAAHPNCASPYGMLALIGLHSVRPLFQIYPPDSPRDCPSPERLEQIGNNLRIAVKFADDALRIERDYYQPWLVKLLSAIPFQDNQYGMPVCAVWFRGNAEEFLRVVRAGLNSLSAPEDRLSLLKDALESTLIQGYFRSDNGVFKSNANGIVPAFLSPSQEADLRTIALKELSVLISAKSISDLDREFAKNALNYLQSKR